jgi:hypothetical protein
MEFIICAAIWVNDKKIHEQQPEGIETGFVICGRRHHNCYQTIKDLLGIDVSSYFTKLNYSDEDYRLHQGFVTSNDRYVGRKEAWIIAKSNNQIRIGLNAVQDETEAILISENLY